jgi:hypothetical protein
MLHFIDLQISIKKQMLLTTSEVQLYREGVWRRGCKTQFILNVSTRWRLSVSYTMRP